MRKARKAALISLHTFAISYNPNSLRGGAMMKAMLVCLMVASLVAVQVASSNRNYKEAALKAARWIRASAMTTDQGRAWPANPADVKTINTSLYSKSDLITGWKGD
jgi:hypothetical protein